MNLIFDILKDQDCYPMNLLCDVYFARFTFGLNFLLMDAIFFLSETYSSLTQYSLFL